ncbi:MAG: hypothetical protein UD936_11195 [Acutalibacteraceae bacterium]|nr:hypothetical protein [Acutalibacteraceae bacterium]
MKICSRCGFENFDEAYLCRKCGSKLKKKKNKSLDLDVQNTSPSGQSYSNSYQQSYTQQTYQGQTYDPYAQQQYQQQYQANQSYQNTYYDTYQGQQYQQNEYQQYQGQQYQQNEYQQYQGQQYQQNEYQQAQSQNRGNADFGTNGGQFNSDNYDNSYSSDYQGSQSDFTEQSVYGNDYNDYNNYNNNYNNYNNGYNNSYNNDYNSSADSNADSFSNNSFNDNSVNDNSFTGNSQQIPFDSQQLPFDPHQFMSNGSKPHVEFTETHNGNRHSFTMTSTTVSPLGGSEIPIPNLDEALDQFKNMAMQHIRPNRNKSHTSVNQFTQKEYTNSARIAEDKLNKPKRFPVVAIVILVIIVAIGGAVVYAGTNSSTAGKNSLFSSSSSVELTIADKAYDLHGDKDAPYSVSFKLPKGYSLETEHFSDSHLKFNKSSNNTESTKQNSKDNETEPAVTGTIFILNESADSKVDEHNRTFPKTDSFETEVKNIETPLGKMSVICIEGAGHYFYHGYVSLGTNHCLSVNTTTTDKKSKTEAYQALELIAQNIAESSGYTFEVTGEYHTLTSYDNDNIKVKVPLFKDYHDPLNSDSNSALIYERNINEEKVLSYIVRINYEKADKVIEENFSAEKFSNMPVSELKSTEQVDTAMGKMTLITYENGYQNYIGIIPIDDNHSIQISVTNVKEEHVEEAKAILDAIAQHGKLTK